MMPFLPGVDVADDVAVRARRLDHAARRRVDDGGDAARLGVERVLPVLRRCHGVPQPAESARETISLTSVESFGGRGDAGDGRARRLPIRLGELRPAVERARDLRCELRVEGVELEDAVGPERVAGAVGAVEAARVGEAERADHAARAVRVGDAEGRVAHQPLDALEHPVALLGRGRLQREPLVDDERIALEHRVEALEGGFGEARAREQQGDERALALGHVRRVLEALVGAARPDRIAALGGVEAEHRAG